MSTCALRSLWNGDFGWDIQLENRVILENYPGDDGPAEVWVRCQHREQETEYNGMSCANNFPASYNITGERRPASC